VKTKFPFWVSNLIISFCAAVILGAALAAFSAGQFFPGWLAFGILLWICSFLLLSVWRAFGSAKALAALMITAFTIRLVMAVLVSAGLPIWGYDNPVNNAGFLYSDAYDRDQAAFKLASSDISLFTVFSSPDKTDQYGGMLFLSSAVYRTLSPDADRPLLISLLSAFIITLGIGFFWAAVQKRWPLRIALIASWLLVLFPDSVFLGSSQMREPFLIGFACIALWAILDWQQKPLRSALVSIATLALSCVFSLPASGIFIAVLAAIVVIEWSLAQKSSLRRGLGFGLLVLVSLAALTAGGMWLKSTLYYDSYTTSQQSGMIQAALLIYGDKIMIPFTSLYGLTQPVLAAAITDTAAPIWKTIAILQSLSWYCALPFLLFGLFSAFKANSKESKWLLVLINLVFLFWVFVSSARAGGDQWDNPRYRYILLPFMSLLIAWSFDHFQKTHSPWFWRWVAVIAEFFLLSMKWYLNRYMDFGTKFSIFFTMEIVGILAVIILGGGLVWDAVIRHVKKPQVNNG
jgi:hypothetical protein